MPLTPSYPRAPAARDPVSLKSLAATLVARGLAPDEDDARDRLVAIFGPWLRGRRRRRKGDAAVLAALLEGFDRAAVDSPETQRLLAVLKEAVEGE
jgi:hypothetical protein